MIKQSQFPRLRVHSLRRRELTAIAALTRPCQIIEFACSAEDDRGNMRGGKIVRRVVGGRSAVFAPAAGPALNDASCVNVDQVTQPASGEGQAVV